MPAGWPPEPPRKTPVAGTGVAVAMPGVQACARMNSAIFGATISRQRRPEKMP